MIETIESFCDRHDACYDDKQWALENCATMLDVWERAKPWLLIWVATRPGVLDDKTLRLFMCWFVRQVWDLLEDKRIRNAVFVAEKFANGDATEDELTAARDVAEAAMAKELAAMSVEWKADLRAATFHAANAVVDCATEHVGETVARVAAGVAARAATRAPSRVAELAAQEKWLRVNAKPNFEVVFKKSESVK